MFKRIGSVALHRREDPVAAREMAVDPALLWYPHLQFQRWVHDVPEE